MSQYDINNLNKKDLQAVTMAGKNYNYAKSIGDTAGMESAHQQAEAIRSKYNYSGGSDGGSFIYKDNPTSSTPYKSEFTDQINSALSSLTKKINTPFSYNSRNDESYQAYLGQQQRLGQDAYRNQLASASTMTGGRMNSWSQGIAANAQSQYNQRAVEALPQFEQQAYSRYQGDLTNQMNMVKTLQGLDSTAYSRYQDDYKKRIYSYEAALKETQQNIANAVDRTNLQGYVSNADALILGVAPGTKSSKIQEEIRAKEDWVFKQQKELENQKKYLSYQYGLRAAEREKEQQYDLELAEKKNEGKTTTVNGEKVEKVDVKEQRITAKKTGDEFFKTVNSEYFMEYDENTQLQYVDSYVKNVLALVDTGEISESQAEELLKQVERTEPGKMYSQRGKLKNDIEAGTFKSPMSFVNGR